MPPDHFALLEAPRRPVLDPALLKESFHRLSATAHPDRHGDHHAAAELNAAYAILRDPASRLRHLLELEQPEELQRAVPVPPKLADAFMRLATLRRAIDAFAGQRSQAATPLSRALLASEQFALQRDVQKELDALEETQLRRLERVQQLDATWGVHPPEIFRELASIQQELSYLGKWHWQLRESLFRLQNP